MIDNFHLQDGRVEFRWRRWRNKKRQEVSACLMVLFSGVALLGGGGIAEAGPTGGQVIGGQGNIAYGGATTTIKQQSQVISINWQTFSTARNETVNFNQPNTSSLAINYVVGGVPSVLQGALNADGRVYILNSAGITFTGTSHVNVGALLATTAMTIDGDPTKKIDVKGSGSGTGDQPGLDPGLRWGLCDPGRALCREHRLHQGRSRDDRAGGDEQVHPRSAR